MKLQIAYTFILSIILIGCNKEDKDFAIDKALSKNNRKFHARYTDRHSNELYYSSSFPINAIDPTKANGLEPIVYLGDTIGYQCYKNGLKHGPYFTMLNKQSLMDGNVVPDGNYKNGMKHGFFYRYRSIYDLHYVAYYENDQLIWADIYRQIETWPRYPFVLNRSNVYIDAKHPNGNPWFKGEYRNRMPYGKHKYYTQNGTKKAEIDYSNNQLIYYYTYKGETDTSIYDFEDKDWKDEKNLIY